MRWEITISVWEVSRRRALIEVSVICLKHDYRDESITQVLVSTVPPGDFT